jgi:hypothetical protein
MNQLPGFRYEKKRKRAFFDGYVTGTNGKVRRRRTIENVTRDQALTAWKAFRDDLASGRAIEGPLTLREFFDRFYRLISAGHGAGTKKTQGHISAAARPVEQCRSSILSVYRGVCFVAQSSALLADSPDMFTDAVYGLALFRVHRARASQGRRRTSAERIAPSKEGPSARHSRDVRGTNTGVASRRSRKI